MRRLYTSTFTITVLFCLAGCNGSDSNKVPAPSATSAKATPKPDPSAKAEEKAAAMVKAQAAAADESPATSTTKTPKTTAVTTSRASQQNAAVAASLRDPSKAALRAPAKFLVKLDTTKGPIFLKVDRSWAPQGVDRFYNLIKAGYYTDVAFFRVIPGFMAQVGLHGDPKVNSTWRSARIQDDPVKKSNTRGMVSFATAGPNTRTTQFFINYGNNARLDGMGFAPFAQVADESMTIISQIHGGYGEGAPRGRGPSQSRIHQEGNRYLKKEFPRLDYIKRASVAAVGHFKVPKAGASTPSAPPIKAAEPAAAKETGAQLDLTKPATLNLKAPAKFRVKLATTKGDIFINVHREWAPNGADRFYNLVKAGYFNDIAFFRVISGFMAQLGISGQPKLNTIWREASIPDDPGKQSNARGMVTYATRGPNTRTTQFFINFRNNAFLDRQGFSPFGQVEEASMKIVDALHAGYGEGAPRGRGPSQGRIHAEGNAYLKAEFPQLDYVKSATIQ